MFGNTQTITLSSSCPSDGAITHQRDDQDLMIHGGEGILEPSGCTERDKGNIWQARVKMGLSERKG